MVMCVDEARHDDAARRVDLSAPTRRQIRADRDDPRALDHHVGLGEISDVRVHRHHRAATDHVAAAGAPAGLGRICAVCGSRTRREQIDACRRRPRDRRSLQEIAARFAD